MKGLDRFILESVELLSSSSERGRYYHTLTPRDNSPSVVHEQTNQLTYVLEGEGVACLDGKSERVCKGECVVVTAGTVHSFKALSEELTLFHIHVPDSGRDNDRRIVDGDDYDRFGG